MCVDDDSYPPIPPIFGGATDTRDLRLTSADGTRFMAYGARATKPTGAGMIVIPDVRGLHQYYKELALRFAEAGVDAVAIDFFARTAPSDDRSDKFDFMSQVPLTKPETLQADIAAAAAYLRGRDGGSVRSLFSVGFCFGTLRRVGRFPQMDPQVKRARMIRIALHNGFQKRNDFRRVRIGHTVARPIVPGSQVHERFGTERRCIKIVRILLGEDLHRIGIGLVQYFAVGLGVTRVPLH